VAELHAVGVSAVLAADAELDLRTGLAPQFDRHLHQSADSTLVHTGKRILLHNFQLLISRQERTGIVAAHAERRLSEVVGAKTEELRLLRNFVGDQSGTRDFDHRADQVPEFDLPFPGHFGGNAVNDLDLELELLRKANQWNHDLGLDLDSLLLHVRGGFKDGAGLHFGNFRKNDTQAAAAMAEHGIELVQLMHALGDLIDRD